MEPSTFAALLPIWILLLVILPAQRRRKRTILANKILNNELENKEMFELAKRFIEKNPDKILWCGEFGTIRHCNIKWRENWMRDVISLLREHDIPYCVWNYLSTPNDGNRFSLVDDDTRRILRDELHRIILGNE